MDAWQLSKSETDYELIIRKRRPYSNKLVNRQTLQSLFANNIPALVTIPNSINGRQEINTIKMWLDMYHVTPPQGETKHSTTHLTHIAKRFLRLPIRDQLSEAPSLGKEVCKMICENQLSIGLSSLITLCLGGRYYRDYFLELDTLILTAMQSSDSQRIFSSKTVYTLLSFPEPRGLIEFSLFHKLIQFHLTRVPEFTQVEDNLRYGLKYAQFPCRKNRLRLIELYNEARYAMWAELHKMVNQGKIAYHAIRPLHTYRTVVYKVKGCSYCK